MKIMKNDFSIEYYKQITKNFFNLIEKTEEKKLNVSSINDCVQIISKIHGYNNWAELKNILIKKEVKNTTDKINFKEKQNKVNFGLKNVIEIQTIKFEIKNKTNLEVFNLKNNINYLNIGQEEQSKVLKNHVFFHLKPVKTLILGNSNLFVQEIEKKLKSNNFNYIYLDSKKNNTENNLKINPWYYMWNSSWLEDYANKINDSTLISIITILKNLEYENSFNISLNKFIYFIKPEGVVNLYYWLLENKPNLSHYIKKYVEKIIKNQNKNIINIIEDEQDLYINKISNLLNELESLKCCYDNNYFFHTDNINNTLSKDNYINIFYKNIKDELKSDYEYFLAIYMNYFLEKLNLNNANKKIWLIFKNCDKNFNFFINHENVIPLYVNKIIQKNDKIDSWEQILFFKDSYFEAGDLIKNKILENTKNLPNIWYNSFEIFNTMKENEFFAWYALNKNEFSNYEFKKFIFQST